MKKYMFVLALLAMLPVSYASGYEYQDSGSQYTTTRSYKRTSKGRNAGGYHNTITNNFYYNQMPRQEVADEEVEYAQPVARRSYTERKETEYTSQTRKYFLAHPFFQPLKGKVGSVTDLSYAKNSFKFDIMDANVLIADHPDSSYVGKVYSGPAGISGKAMTSQFVAKEDISVGLSDTLALMLMAQYDKTKVKFDYWSGGEAGDEVSHSGINIFGVGLQDRFVDNDEWIAMFSAFFQHQKDTANTFEVDIKAGYKINRTTVYGLARVNYTNLIEGEMYGALVDDPTGDWIMLSYKQGVKDMLSLEAGLGAFSVLNKYMYLGGELVYGHYDWHNQLNIRGTIGFQPRDSFALSFYAMAALADSAKDQVKQYVNYDVDPDDLQVYDEHGTLVDTITDSKLDWTTGNYKIKSYNEWKIGVQAILYF